MGIFIWPNRLAPIRFPAESRRNLMNLSLQKNRFAAYRVLFVALRQQGILHQIPGVN
jgi:hypothetical protein